MKNYSLNKSILLHSLCITGTIFLASSCTDENTVDSKEIAEEKNVAQIASQNETFVIFENDTDAKFLIDAAEMQLEEISLGKLAQEKGTTAEVKELGKMMEKDHTKTLKELKTLARSKSVSIPASITEDSKDSYEKLNKKSGTDFDKAYADRMVEHHEDAIKMFEEASAESKDAEIRTWASDKLPGLKTHLKHAEACKKECAKKKS